MYTTWEEVFSLKDDKNNPLYNEDFIKNLLDFFVEYKRTLCALFSNDSDSEFYKERKNAIEQDILSYGIKEFPTISKQEVELFKRFCIGYPSSMSYYDYDKDFYSLKEKYLNNKWEFYIQCKKSQMIHNRGFELKIGKRDVTVIFQTDRYDLIMKRYLRAIYLLEGYQDRFEKIVNKLYIRNLDNFEKEKEKLNFTLAENYEISYCQKHNAPDKESAAACYSDISKSIVLFFNARYRPRKKYTIPDIEHELGHFFNDALRKNESENGLNEILSSIKKDWKLSFINQKIINGGSEARKVWYHHVSPPRSFKTKKNHYLLNHTKSKELFAESFSQALILILAKKKVCRKGEETWLINMFPHTKYLIDKLLDGKRANRFKRLKPLRKGLKNV